MENSSLSYNGYGFDETTNFSSYVDFANYDDIPYPGVVPTVPVYEVVLKSYLFAMIMFFSLVGNTLIIVVVLRHKQMRTTTNFYIVNLAVADILVTLFCTWVHLVNNLNSNHWVLGRFFCKFNTFTQVLCLVASVLSLTLIAYDRFFGIVFALKAHMTNRKARFSILLIWACSTAVAAPLLYFRELKERQWKDLTERWCDDVWPVVDGRMPARTAYFCVVTAVLYFFPMIVMTIAYSIIIAKLRHSTIPGERVESGLSAQQKTKRKVIAMLITIMSVFGICWLPYQIVLLHSELRESREELGDWYFQLEFLAGCFAFSNSALNPLIYAGFNKNFKQALMLMKTDIGAFNRGQSGSLMLKNLMRRNTTFVSPEHRHNRSRSTSACTMTSVHLKVFSKHEMNRNLSCLQLNNMQRNIVSRNSNFQRHTMKENQRRMTMYEMRSYTDGRTSLVQHISQEGKLRRYSFEDELADHFQLLYKHDC